MPHLFLSLFGSIDIRLDDTPLKRFRSDKVLALLIYLVVESDRPHRRESLAGLLWPDHTEADARHNLSQSLLRLRKVIQDHTAEPPFLLVNRQSLQFNQDSDYQLDVTTFKNPGGGNRTNADSTLTNDELQLMRQAVRLYRGDFLAQFSLPDSDIFEEWMLVKREHYRQQALNLLHQLITHYDAQGEYEAAHHYAWQQIELNAFNEEAHRVLMRLLALSGQRSAALAQYETCVQVLQDELGVEPATETTVLYEQIRDGVITAATKPLPTEAPIVSMSLTPEKRPDAISLRSRLDPIGGQTLFGIDDIRQQLIDVAQQPDRPWIIAIDGLGGIGKTTIANEVAHHFVEGETFFNIGWVSAKQEEFLTETGLNDTGNPALSEASMTHLLLEQLMENPNLAASDDEKRLTLTHLLKEKPHLIFVDNLETMADQDALIPTLRHLVGPSKFVLTSRISLKAHSDVFCLSLSELTPTDSIRFLRHESTARGIAGLENASDEQLERIYEVVGGNPLALKLIIGQITYLPLGQVLENLIQAKGKQVDQFYTYLYWQAWNRLSEMERMLFLSMPLVPNATFSQLSLASELEFDDVQASLAKLISLSLILVAGDLEEPRYRLHRLTETFLMNEVLKWS